MDYILTFVASSGDDVLEVQHIKAARDILSAQGIKAGDRPDWLSDQKAAALPVAGALSRDVMAMLRESLHAPAIDVFITPAAHRRKALLLADMDSTIVNGETLDELAAKAGVGDRVAAVTKRAMNGEINFEEALRARVSLLNGLPVSVLEAVVSSVEVNPGAQALVQTMKAHGAFCVLVSGGFTQFTQAAAQQLGFDAHHGNTLEINGDSLTGTVGNPVLDKESKLAFLNHYMTMHELKPYDVLAIGDGANDLAMLGAAGLGVGYHPKPVVADALDNVIVHGDLRAALYAQGYRDGEITGV